MKIIKPHPITDSMLVSSSVAENDYPAWVSGTTYALGARVIRASVHKVFERLVAGAGTVAPELDTTSPAVWMDIGPTKKWAPFDNVVGTLATGASPLNYTLRTEAGEGPLALLRLRDFTLPAQIFQIQAVPLVPAEKPFDPDAIAEEP